jgi:hypothetical protein
MSARKPLSAGSTIAVEVPDGDGAATLDGLAGEGALLGRVTGLARSCSRDPVTRAVVDAWVPLWPVRMALFRAEGFILDPAQAPRVS